MEMVELLKIIKAKFSNYIKDINDLDSRTVKNAVKQYISRLDDVFDSNGIKANIDELAFELEEAIEDESRTNSRKANREEAESIFKRDVDRKMEEMEGTDKEESSYLVSRMIINMEDSVDEESKRSFNKMESKLSEVLAIANQTTLNYLIEKGFYNLEDTIYDLNHIAKTIQERQMDEYGEEMKSLGKDMIESTHDEFTGAKKHENEIDEQLGANLRNIYEKYERGDIDGEITLVPGDLALKVCIVEEPIFAFSDEPIQKGLCVSKSILDRALEEENKDLVTDEEKYVIVERSSYNMLITENENDKIQEYNANKQRTVEAQKEKYTPKMSEPEEYHDFL